MATTVTLTQTLYTYSSVTYYNCSLMLKRLKLSIKRDDQRQ